MSTKTQQALSELFNVDDIPDQRSEQPQNQLVCVDQQQPYDIQAEDDAIKQNVEQDYQTVRSNLRHLISQGENLLDLAVQLAENDQTFKTVDSVTKLLGQIADINIKLIDVTAKKQNVLIKTRPREYNTDSNNNNNITNNTAIMFTGSTDQLLKMIEQSNKSQSAIDVEGTITDVKTTTN